MAILIDPPAWPAHGTVFSHLVSDASFEELHEFAARAGLPERAFDRDHYDVPERRYDGLVVLGAEPVRSRELVQRLIGSGLRRRKHLTYPEGDVAGGVPTAGSAGSVGSAGLAGSGGSAGSAGSAGSVGSAGSAGLAGLAGSDG